MQLTAVQDTPAKRAAVSECNALLLRDPRNGEANAMIVERRAWSGRGHRKRRKDGKYRGEIWTKLPSMTSWAEGVSSVQVRLFVLLSATRGLFAGRQRLLQSRTLLGKSPLAWGRAISDPEYGRHATLLATTASGGFKYE